MMKKKPTMALTDPKKLYKHESLMVSIQAKSGAIQFKTRIEDLDDAGVKAFEGETTQESKLMPGDRAIVKYARTTGLYTFSAQLKQVIPTGADRRLLILTLPTKITKLKTKKKR
jgi:hypothetical protein